MMLPGLPSYSSKEALQKGISSMSTEDNKAIVRRWTEEGWNQRNWAVFDELAAFNWIIHDPSLPQVRTLEDYKRWATETCNAFPDNHVTIDGMPTEGGKV